MFEIIKPFIKVPLVLVENAVFGIFPGLRPMVEKYLYNPFDFSDAHIAYTRKKYQQFREKIPPSFSLTEKTILELGPGGSIGFGLLALEDGAGHYIALEEGRHAFLTPDKKRDLLRLLDSSSDPARYFSGTENHPTYNQDLIAYRSIDQASRYPLADASVDVIYSCAVLEHVHDLELCFREMERVLRPGGIMYHEVDLRDHIFSQKSLWFLSIPEFWFRLLFGNTGGYVNRKRASHYQNLARKYRLVLHSFEATLEAERRSVAEDLKTLGFITVLAKE